MADQLLESAHPVSQGDTTAHLRGEKELIAAFSRLKELEGLRQIRGRDDQGILFGIEVVADRDRLDRAHQALFDNLTVLDKTNPKNFFTGLTGHEDSSDYSSSSRVVPS
ncbi:hypothetical protein [Persicimonas caeni]|uniref:hypothetical protein n=1 Tax=Persicimonas caeni TaxID=2292766 RepID=UPI00143DF3EE|nr:hypothetical protein [Persicimonas caeni]